MVHPCHMSWLVLQSHFIHAVLAGSEACVMHRLWTIRSGSPKPRPSLHYWNQNFPSHYYMIFRPDGSPILAQYSLLGSELYENVIDRELFDLPSTWWYIFVRIATLLFSELWLQVISWSEEKCKTCNSRCSLYAGGLGASLAESSHIHNSKILPDEFRLFILKT